MTSQETRDRLEQIRERERKASPGPWVIDLNVHEISTELAEVFQIATWMDAEPPTDQHWDDADFISHAREDIPYLLARLQSVEALAAAAEAVLRAQAAEKAWNYDLGILDVMMDEDGLDMEHEEYMNHTRDFAFEMTREALTAYRGGKEA